MDIKPSIVADAQHQKPAPGKVECDCAACWQVRQLRQASPIRQEPARVIVWTLRAIGGVL